MNIREAKQEIAHAMAAYLEQDETGERLIPVSRQRPVFLIGAPGIGKTAIIRQIADELGVGLVSYSMTHHTRQSALGLPFIVKKEYGGIEHDVSEYTMSEIIASVYDEMEETGHTQGILFLDEINCVSETLTPAMLQFLQFKTFGRHRVPDGWIVVTAGNPPEYNRSVREFDIVTWDRLKRIDVEPDLKAWKEYALEANVHRSIITYLELKPTDFYKVETTVDGKRFVTPRGWDDLSQMIVAYERMGIDVNEKLVGQYLQNQKIAKDYAIYYDLYRKYRAEYRIEDILEDGAHDELKHRVKHAPFDERISLLGLLLDHLNGSLRETMRTDSYVQHLHDVLKREKPALQGSPTRAKRAIKKACEEHRQACESTHKNDEPLSDRRFTQNRALAFFEELEKDAGKMQKEFGFPIVEAAFNNEVAKLKADTDATGRQLNNLFSFVEDTFGESQEMLLVVTELSLSSHGMRYISEYGCEKYFTYNKDLLLHERHKELDARLKNLILSKAFTIQK